MIVLLLIFSLLSAEISTIPPPLSSVSARCSFDDFARTIALRRHRLLFAHAKSPLFRSSLHRLVSSLPTFCVLLISSLTRTHTYTHTNTQNTHTPTHHTHTHTHKTHTPTHLPPTHPPTHTHTHTHTHRTHTHTQNTHTHTHSPHTHTHPSHTHTQHSVRDGIGLAWAISEFLLAMPCFTLFTTHFKELGEPPPPTRHVQCLIDTCKHTHTHTHHMHTHTHTIGGVLPLIMHTFRLVHAHTQTPHKHPFTHLRTHTRTSLEAPSSCTFHFDTCTHTHSHEHNNHSSSLVREFLFVPVTA
jgi:hypothetical protein